ncbi:MAG: polysaccharide export protein [Rhodospirillales bacterium]|nr:polysaccharide export protein [Rhodospirillales bacterium]
MLRLIALLALLIQFSTVTALVGAEALYTLGSGDKLKITVYGQKELSGEFEVNGVGVVSMPLIGDVAVNGQTQKQAEDNIIRLLEDGYLKHPKVSIEVQNYRPFYIIGEVKKPGNYPYVNGMTILNAVAIASGFTYRANEKQILIIRGNDPDKTQQPTTPAARVLPGDIIKIQERFF